MIDEYPVLIFVKAERPSILFFLDPGLALSQVAEQGTGDPRLPSGRWILPWSANMSFLTSESEGLWYFVIKLSGGQHSKSKVQSPRSKVVRCNIRGATRQAMRPIGAASCPLKVALWRCVLWGFLLPVDYGRPFCGLFTVGDCGPRTLDDCFPVHSVNGIQIIRPINFRLLAGSAYAKMLAIK
jgi:hypothetical protein